jgi:hypothetical protein
VAIALSLVGVAAVAQVSFAGDRRTQGLPPCPTAAGPTAPGTAAPTGASPTAPAGPSASAGVVDPNQVAAHNHTDVTHVGDGADATANTFRRRPGGSNCTPTTSGGSQGSPAATPAPLQPLGKDCTNSRLQPHDGFQNGSRCIDTAFGEVGDAEDNPTLLITSAPRAVRVNQAFQIRVSTRNLVRDRFLAAGQGGYYLESSFLNGEGLVRGHFHTACRLLTRRLAPEASPPPAFFLATEDRRGSAQPDEVTINVPGLTAPGIYQCAAWAGDGSHRIPMMARANQVPAFDAVRVIVTR